METQRYGEKSGGEGFDLRVGDRVGMTSSGEQEVNTSWKATEWRTYQGVNGPSCQKMELGLPLGVEKA